MKAAKPCNDRFEDIVAFVMGELAPPAAGELQGHIATCDKCRTTRDALVEEEKDVRSGFEALAHNLGSLEEMVLRQRQHPTSVRVHVSNNRFLERVKNMILAHKRLSVVAATATALAASFVLYVLLASSSTAAYALEQVVQASNRVTSYHVKTTPGPAEGASEGWIQLNPDGTILRARLDIFDSGDGPKVSIISPERCEVWFKMKHSHVILGSKDDKELIEHALKGIQASRASFDPKLAFEQLQADEKAGKVQVETREPAKPGELATLTVRSKDKPDQWQVYEVDPESKLVEQVVEWRREGDRQKVVSLREYLDYNQPFDPKIFQLELPKHVITIDRVSNITGLDKGNLSDDEIATKVVREFFEALIAEDYKKAGMILGGMPADRTKELFRRTRFLRIVEIGKPVPGKYPEMRALQVPAKVEWEMGPQKVPKTLTLTVPSADAETATKAAREFFEALIAQDYKQAERISQETGLVLQGVSAEEMKDSKKLFGDRAKPLRIVEIGKPSPKAENGSTEVSVKVEMEVTVPRQVHDFSPYVRPESGGRWAICGGI